MTIKALERRMLAASTELESSGDVARSLQLVELISSLDSTIKQIHT